MLVGRVIRDEVDDDPNAAPVGLRHQRVEVGERPEDGIDVAVVRDVVAEVGHRRRIERREPDGIDTERTRCRRGGRAGR